MVVRVGVLALQGAVEPHKKKLEELGVDVCEVRTEADLARIDALIMPGGESTTMLKLIDHQKLWEALKAFVQTKPVWGVCAGAILLAKSVTSPSQKSLGVIDLTAIRNAYGRQSDSFITEDLEYDPETFKAGDEALEAVFIRAPRFSDFGPNVQILIRYKGEPVMVRENKVLLSSFHPELSTGHRIHSYFLALTN
jgi:5'-phosphate synthase pdxT subunit